MEKPKVVHIYKSEDGVLFGMLVHGLPVAAEYIGPYTPLPLGAFVIESEDELARLRRLADVGAKSFVEVYGKGEWNCSCCVRDTWSFETNSVNKNVKHTATCDAAIHLGLERDGE